MNLRTCEALNKILVFENKNVTVASLRHCLR